MADHAEVEYATATGNDYAEHEKTYKFFIGLAKWGTVSVIILLILMAYFLVCRRPGLPPWRAVRRRVTQARPTPAGIVGAP